MPGEDAGPRCQLDWEPWPCWSPPGPASQLPTAGRGFRESLAVLFSDTRGEPCLGFPGAGGRLGPCRDCAVHQSLGVLPSLLRGSQGHSRLVAFAFPLAVFRCAAAWVTHRDAMGCVPARHGSSSPCPAPSLAASPLGQALECRVGWMEALPPAHRSVGFVVWSRGSAPISIQPLSWQPRAPEPTVLLSNGEGRVTYFALCLVSSPAQVEEKEGCPALAG